jgi:hypothetical protein
MRTDRTTKVLLALIAIGLWLNAMVPLFHPIRAVRASSKFTCGGKLKASAFGATQFPGGYDVDVTCEE